MKILEELLQSSLAMFLAAAPFMVFGLVIAGLLKALLRPETVSRTLGRGPVASVFKAALVGVPMPLCSCGVLPVAQSLGRQGATRGAVASFLIATPESGVDSIAVSYALLDPILAVARPLAAFVSAVVAGLTINVTGPPSEMAPPSQEGDRWRRETVLGGIRYAFGDLWADMAGAFFVGVVLSGAVAAFVPEDLLGRFLGGGLFSMAVMFLVGVPLYVCATSSTPLAAALILKGVSPGAALVFLLAGPATNMASLSVLLRTYGRRFVALYLGAIAAVSFAFGLAVDALYGVLGRSPSAVMGEAAEVLPFGVSVGAALILAATALPGLIRIFRPSSPSCGCGAGCDRH
ncbi:MAG: permease [Synergistaceae bacterium]|jgi:hypothetical protein|nr:permease [Synergistaceae bacterium]